MRLWYTDINYLSKESYERAMEALPEFVFKEIDRFHQLNDKKSRLLSRLMVQLYCVENGYAWNWSHWKNDHNQKPYFENGPFFNISHSEDKVVLVFSDNNAVGVDVERITKIDTVSLIPYFHPDERVLLDGGTLDAFFRIWTRKEALLKAIGVGILNGLNNVSVLNDKIEYEGKWQLRDIGLFEEYKVAICSSREENEIILKQIDRTQLKAFIDEKILL